MAEQDPTFRIPLEVIQPIIQPKVDPLVEKIIAVQYRVRVEAVENCTIGRPDTVLREAEAIAAEVRKFAALDAMKEDALSRIPQSAPATLIQIPKLSADEEAKLRPPIVASFDAMDDEVDPLLDSNAHQSQTALIAWLIAERSRLQH